MMVALTIALCASVAAGAKASEGTGEIYSNPVEDLFEPGKPFVPGISPPIMQDKVREHNMNWGRTRSALSGGFIELNGAETRKLKQKEMDVQVAQAAVVGQERELSRVEKRFETVSHTERAVMHDYRQKYLNEKREQKMYEDELRDDNRLKIYQANLINNFTALKAQQASLTQIEARVRSTLDGEMVNLTALQNDIAALEAVNQSLNGPGRDDERFDAKQAELMVLGAQVTEEFNNNVYKVQDIKNRSDTVLKQLDDAELVLHNILQKFVEKHNKDSLAKMINANGSAFSFVLEKFGIGAWAK